MQEPGKTDPTGYVTASGALGTIHRWPAFGLSSFMVGTSLFLPKHPSLPPFVQRFSFGLIFAGAGYIVSTGDVGNGSGTATAWSLAYLLLNHMRTHFYPPEVPIRRTPLSLLLSGATTSVAALYGIEYFAINPGSQIAEDVS